MEDKDVYRCRGCGDVKKVKKGEDPGVCGTCVTLYRMAQSGFFTPR